MDWLIKLESPVAGWALHQLIQWFHTAIKEPVCSCLGAWPSVISASFKGGCFHGHRRIALQTGLPASLSTCHGRGEVFPQPSSRNLGTYAGWITLEVKPTAKGMLCMDWLRTVLLEPQVSQVHGIS